VSLKRAIREYLLTFLAIIGLVLLAAGTAVYVLDQQRLRFPFVEEQPFRLQVELDDAQAVTAGQGQSVTVAGVKVGDVGKVELEDGRALVTLDLEPRYKGLVRADATALLRSKTGLKDMLVEIAPGEGRPLSDGERIPSERSASDVDLDEILSALDSDTRDYLKLLVSGLGKGARGRGADAREALRRLGPLTRDLARVNSAVADRRRELRRLVHRYGLLATTLGRSDRDLVRLVGTSNATFEALASVRGDLSSAIAQLPESLDSTHSALQSVSALSERLPPAVAALRPAVRELDPATRAALPLARDATPILRDELRPLARAARPELRVLGSAARNLVKAGPDLDRALGHANRLLNLLSFNPEGAESLAGKSFDEQRSREEGYLYWFAWSGQIANNLLSSADGQGVLRRFTLGGTNCSVLETAGVSGPIADALGAAGLCNATVP
jgi:phospholipid/cholesterol/gamma-HCH transport system substrate-binding protein